jgi:hypothetical protein
MTRKYIAFDVETAKELPGQTQNLLEHRPLGIACAATISSSDAEPKFWFGKDTDGKPALRMSRADLAELIEFLTKSVLEGYAILTWNGVGFDFDILAEESGLTKECQQLARAHVDMMFHIFCDRGFPVGLESATKGMNVTGKSKALAGHLAPQYWREGRHDEVLSYVAQDVRCTLDLALACEQAREFRWITRKGTTSKLPLKSGWLTVEEALKLPEPDVSWMDNPMRRSRFTGWLQP